MTDRARGGWAVGGVLAAVVWAAYRAAVDLDPPALWLDDAWVAAFARAPGFGLGLVQPASAPPLFMTAVGLGMRLAPDLELGAQLWPSAAGLLAIAGTGALAFRLTRSPAIATLAAVLLACDTGLLIYLARVKPFTGDALATVALGLAFSALLARPGRRQLWSFVGVATLGFAISTFSLLVAGATAAVAGVALWLRGERDRQLWLAAAVLATVAAAFSLHIAGRPRAQMLSDYWSPFHLRSIDDLIGLARYAFGRLLHAEGLHVGPLPPVAVRVAGMGLSLLGAVELWRRGERLQLVAGASVVLAAMVAAALGLIPLGALRTDTFLLPIGAVLLACGAGLLLRPLATQRRELALVLLLGVVVLQVFEGRVARYPIEEGAQPVAELARRLRQGDQLAANLHGSFALGTYWPGPIVYRDDPRFTIPHPEPAIETFSILDDASFRRVAQLPVVPDVVPEPRDAGAAARGARSWVFLCHYQPALLEDLLRRMGTAGHRTVAAKRWRGCGLWLFEPVPRPRPAPALDTSSPTTNLGPPAQEGLDQVWTRRAASRPSASVSSESATARARSCRASSTTETAIPRWPSV